LGTGRPAFWGVGVAKAMVARERAMARVNFILADGFGCGWFGIGVVVEKLLIAIVKTDLRKRSE
jgi:hypothetical protein